MRLTAQDMQTIRDTLRTWGVLSMASAALGCRLGDLKAAIARDPDLQAEVNEALEEHNEALYAKAVQRGAMGGSDALLGRLLEAKMPKLFDPKARNAEAAARGKPTGLRLRTFEADENGDVVDATPKEPTPPAEPLRIGWVPI